MAKQPPTPEVDDDEPDRDPSASVTRADARVKWYQTAAAAERAAAAKKKAKRKTHPK